MPKLVIGILIDASGSRSSHIPGVPPAAPCAHAASGFDPDEDDPLSEELELEELDELLEESDEELDELEDELLDEDEELLELEESEELDDESELEDEESEPLPEPLAGGKGTLAMVRFS